LVPFPFLAVGSVAVAAAAAALSGARRCFSLIFQLSTLLPPQVTLLLIAVALSLRLLLLLLLLAATCLRTAERRPCGHACNNLFPVDANMSSAATAVAAAASAALAIATIYMVL